MEKIKYMVNLDNEIHDKGVESAKEKRRSFSQYVEDLIFEDIKNTNFLSKHN